jgi:hypothetical protein
MPFFSALLRDKSHQKLDKTNFSDSKYKERIIYFLMNNNDKCDGIGEDERNFILFILCAVTLST